jgi:tetratricopeptide (TPR) repeat protein/type II secretory pathway component PulM
LSEAAKDEHPHLIANRYRVQETLGEGGMGVVYRVTDVSTKRELALKQLKARDSQRKQLYMEELFEREFHTLSHLSHPRVIEVYDYSRDKNGPYYTMELLDGGDLRQLAPLPWATACMLLCDICSALSLLHSRRFIHRDLSTRNIRCTRDNKAKLIDFGAMAPMGVSRVLAGTVQFTAPEALNGQALDARTDLYALGVAAYFALTGRHLYPAATSFGTLRDAWRSPPPPPSTYKPEIPKELDQLVISLIHLDPMARPASAAEVMERLSAIARVQIDEQLMVRQAYLATPTLIGRDQLILRVRKLMVRAMHRRGGTLLISGLAGMGRSRVLDTCVLEGKLAGAAVLRADASDATAGSWGAVKSLAQQLIDAAPRTALQAARPYAALLENVLPGLANRLEEEANEVRASDPSPGDSGDSRTSVVVESDPPDAAHLFKPRQSMAPKGFDPLSAQRPQLFRALLSWLLEVSEKRGVVVAVDDVHRIDEPSAAFVALLSNKAAKHRVVVAVTAETGAAATSQPALSLLSDVGIAIKLDPIRLEETEKLLQSIFGDVPNVRLLSDRIHRVSGGNPKAVMLLAQHFLDTGLVRYETGGWILPESIDAVDLPQTLSDALKMRVRNLSDEAKKLALSVALCSAQSLSFEECLFLVDHKDKSRLIQDIEQLVAFEILWTDGTWYALGQAIWRQVLIEEIPAKQARAIHLRLAAFFEKRESEGLWITQHLLQANKPERALDVFLSTIDSQYEGVLNNPERVLEFVNSLPEEWIVTVKKLLEVCQQLGRPAGQRFRIQRHVASCAAITAQPEQAEFISLMRQLHFCCGLDLYETLDATLDESARLKKALELAQQRFDMTPERERVLPPSEAIPQLARVIVQAIGSVGHAMDYGFFESITSLQPLVPLSPALGVIEKNYQSSRHAQGGRYQKARWGWIEAIERLDQPDLAGLDKVHHTYMRLAMVYTLGRTEAILGLQSAEKWADQIEQNPLFEVNAWRLHMLLALFRCDRQKAEECRKRAELLQIQKSPTQIFEGLHLWTELIAFAALDDLLGVKQTLPSVEKIAAKYPGWKPALHFARGQYQKIRGDYAEALAEFEQALALTEPGRHTTWAQNASACLSTLLSLEQFDRVITLAEEALPAAEREDPIYMGIPIRQPLALAYAAQNKFDRAIENTQAVIDLLEAMNASGVVLGSAYETRVRVAIRMEDRAGFKTYSTLCAEQYRVGKNPTLTVKFEKLIQQASLVALEVSTEIADSLDSNLRYESAIADLSAIFGTYDTADERAQRALEILVLQCEWSTGLLYTMQKQGPVLVATFGDVPSSTGIDALVSTYLAAELENSQEETITQTVGANSPASDTSWKSLDGQRFVPLLLSHEIEQGWVITGAVVVGVAPDDFLEIPMKLLAALSKSLMDAGDVVTAFAA